MTQEARVQYLDAGLCGSTQPVSVWGEAQGMDDITSIQRVQPLALSQVPQHSHTILDSPHQHQQDASLMTA